MIDPNVLKVGDVFFDVREQNNGLFRTKIRQEIDGVEWFRYDKPVFTYKIVECLVLGILEKNLKGTWDPDGKYELETCYYIEDDTQRYAYGFYELSNDQNIFIDKSEALLYKETMELKAKEIDRK
jgi:hypothetical protein